MMQATTLSAVTGVLLFGLTAFAQESRVRTASSVARQAAPAARITIVDPASVNRLGSSAGEVSSTAVPTARLRVVNDVLIGKAKLETPQDRDTESKAVVADAKAAVAAADTPPEIAAVDPELAKLAGTWRAVARQGDGELTTVELQLDNRGWAKFTVPAGDGKPTTIKQRAEMNGEELKLTGFGMNLPLGQLLEVNDRQMVLALSEGTLTFVRPQ
jgi:hypothetical protein